MTDSSETTESTSTAGDEGSERAERRPRPDRRIVVVGADDDGDPAPLAQDADEAAEGVDALVSEPAKVMRIGTMIKQLLDEVRSAPLDARARARLAEVHERSLAELEQGLSPELIEELHRITLPFADDGDTPPSDAELRIAQAQLVGWLEGLFHGIQTALVAQQMAAQAQLSQMRRALPPGPGLVVPGAQTAEDHPTGTGQYL